METFEPVPLDPEFIKSRLNAAAELARTSAPGEAP